MRKCLKIAVFWYMTPCTLLKAYRRFRRHYCLRHQYLLKRRGTYMGLHDVTCQETAVFTYMGLHDVTCQETAVFIWDYMT